MHWVAGWLCLFVVYAIYAVAEGVSPGLISDRLIPYFGWLFPFSLPGRFLISVLVLVPLYALLSLLTWLLAKWGIWGEAWSDDPLRMGVEETCQVGSGKVEGVRRPLWPLAVFAFMALFLVYLLFVIVFLRRGAPAHWVIGCLLLFSLIVYWLSLPQFAAANKSPRRLDQPEKPCRDSSKEFLRWLRQQPRYKGQLAREISNETAGPHFVGASDLPGPEERRSLVKGFLKKLGIADLYGHQFQFLESIFKGRNSILMTPFGSGRLTAVGLACVDQVLAGGSVLVICADEQTAAVCNRRLRNLLDRGEWGWGVQLSCHASQGSSFDPAEQSPDILIVTPEMLHADILPNHPRYEEFLRAMGLVVVLDVEFYTGVFGSNVAYVLRRLLRVCRLQRAQPVLACVGIRVTSGLRFCEQLTGERFSETDCFTTDGKDRHATSEAFWATVYEKEQKGVVSRQTSPALKRTDYYDEACAFVVEVFLKGFDVALIGSHVLLTEKEAHLISEKIQDRLTSRIANDYESGIRQVVDFVQGQLPLLRVEAAKLIPVTAAPGGPSPTKAAGLAVNAQPPYDVTLSAVAESAAAELQRIVSDYEGLASQVSRALSEPTSAVSRIQALLTDALNSLRARADEQGGGAVGLCANEVKGNGSDEVLTPEEDLKLRIAGFARRVAGVISSSLDNLRDVQEAYKKSTVRAAEGKRRWIVQSVNDLRAQEAQVADVSAWIFLDFPFHPSILYQQVCHGGPGYRTPVDKPDQLVCVCIAPTPHSQYYKNHWDEVRERDEGRLIVLGIDNPVMAMNHLLCTLDEHPMRSSEVRDLFPILSRAVIVGRPAVKVAKKTFVARKGMDVVECEEEWFTYERQGDVRPHRNVNLYSVCDRPYSIVRFAEHTTGTAVGVLDSCRVRALAYDHAILQVGERKYRVSGNPDDANRRVLVKDEDSHYTTERSNVVSVELLSYRVLRGTSREYIGNVDSALVQTREFRPGSGVMVEGQSYTVVSVDQEVKTVSIEAGVGDAPETCLELVAPVTIERVPGEGFSLLGSHVRVREQITGWHSFNAVDTQDLKARAPGSLDVPLLREFDTYGVFLCFPNHTPSEGALHAVSHLIRAFAPTILAAAEAELEVAFVPSHLALNGPSILVYDDREGGLGFSKMIWEEGHSILLNTILERAYQVLIDCPCLDGCESCLHIMQCRCQPLNAPLNKREALELLGKMLGKEDVERVIKNRYERITESSDAVAIRDKVFQILRVNLGMTWKKPVELVVSTKREEELERERHHTPRLEEWTDAHDAVIVRENREDNMVILAHVYTHDWEGVEGNMDSRLADPQYIKTEILRKFERSADVFVEGFCEWVAFKALDFYGLKYEMELFGKYRSLPLVYRAGFELIKYIEDCRGVKGVMDFITTGEGWDFEELYRDSGVLGYVLDQLEKKKDAPGSDKGKADSTKT